MEEEKKSVEGQEIPEGVINSDMPDANPEVTEGSDKASAGGVITEVEESDKPMPPQADLGVLPNRNPRFQHLLSNKPDPKTLITRNESQVDKAITGYYEDGDIESLQQFMKLYMHFPRNLVRKVEGFLDTLVNKKAAAEGLTKSELMEKEDHQLMAVGSKLGLFFNGRKTKEEMIEAIIDMQKMNIKRQKV